LTASYYREHRDCMDDSGTLGLMFAVPGLAIAVLVGLWCVLMKRRNR